MAPGEMRGVDGPGSWTHPGQGGETLKNFSKNKPRFSQSLEEIFNDLFKHFTSFDRIYKIILFIRNLTHVTCIVPEHSEKSEHKMIF